jgi:hypothetical protein
MYFMMDLIIKLIFTIFIPVRAILITNEVFVIFFLIPT